MSAESVAVEGRRVRGANGLELALDAFGEKDVTRRSSSS